jgi:hypothetical protein
VGVRVIRVAVFAWIMFLFGCSSMTEQTVDRTVSSDGRFWADVSVNRGSALKSDWYAVAVGKVHPDWIQTIFRRAGITICTLQGPGQIAISWKGPDELLVTCTSCRQRDVYIRERRWDNISIDYAFPKAKAN